MGANRKFTIWQLYFHTCSLHSIFQIWQNYCFLSKINTLPQPVPFTILMSPYCLTIHHSLHYIWIYLLRSAISQSIDELKTGGKTLDNPNDLFVRRDKKNSLKLLFQPFTRVRLERPNTHAWYRIENANYVTQALEGLVMEVTVWISQRKKSPRKFSLLSEINFHLILESRGVGSTLLQSHAGFIIEGDTPYRHKMHMLKF